MHFGPEGRRQASRRPLASGAMDRAALSSAGRRERVGDSDLRSRAAGRAAGKKEGHMADATQAHLPTPDPALRRLERFIGTWSMEGHLVGSDEITVRGETTFRWLTGGFFLEQKARLN